MRERSAPRRLTFVPFLRDGRCALVQGERLALPSGGLLPGEDPLLDGSLRVPLEAAGFRRQEAYGLAADGDQLVLWGVGDPGYQGSRPHAVVSLWTGGAAEAAARLRRAGDERGAALVEAADRARRSLDWEAPDGRRFDFVHALLDLVPEARVPELLDHLLDRVVAPGGRLLVSNYVPIDQWERHPAAVLGRLGLEVGGITERGDPGGRAVPPTAWVVRGGRGS